MCNFCVYVCVPVFIFYKIQVLWTRRRGMKGREGRGIGKTVEWMGHNFPMLIYE